MSLKVLKTQLAAVIPGPKESVVIQCDVPVTQPSELKPGQCLVKMICSGVCHTDLHVSKWDWPLQATAPFIGGHEGVGEIVAIADNTEASPIKLGQRMGIKWIAYSCGDCEPCHAGLEQNCANVKLSGYTVNGTFSQYVSWVYDVTPIPETMDSFAAASLLCAGVTVYRALKYSDARIGQWVVIPGAGGGLGHLDTGEEKKKLCLELGAEKWIDFKQTPHLVKGIQDACDGLGPHCAIVTSPHSEGYAQAVDYLRPGGTLMAVGIPAHAKLGTSIFWTVVKGSYVGNRQDSIEAIEIANSGKVKVIYASRGLTDLRQVYDDLEEGKVARRIVLDALR